VGADLATLAIAVDATGVSKGVAELDKLTAAGARAEIATGKVAAGSKSASQAAAAYAADAQRMSSASMGVASSLDRVGHSTAGVSLQTREMLVLMREASVGNFTRMAGSATILAQSLQSTGQSIGGVVTNLLKMIGVLKTTTDAEVAATAASAAGFQKTIAGYAQQAAGAIHAADAEMAMAQAQMRVAVTAAERTAATARMTAGQEAANAATAQAVIADEALAAANREVAVTAGQAEAATVVGLSGIGVAAVAIATALGGAFIAVKKFQSSVNDDASLKAYADTLGLTHKELKRLENTALEGSEKLKNTGKNYEVFKVTLGDVFHGLVQTAEDAYRKIADTGPVQKAASVLGRAMSTVWDIIADGAKIVGVTIYTVFVGGYRAIVDTFKLLPAALGDAFYSAVNLAITAINKLTKAGIDAVNAISQGVNGAFGAFGLNIGKISDFNISPLENKFAGSSAKIAATLKNDYLGAAKEASGAFEKLGSLTRKNILGARNERVGDLAAGIIDDRHATKEKKGPKDKNPEALAALQAEIDGNYKLADAYQVSDAAALIAEATIKGLAAATKNHGDAETYVALEIEKAVSARVEAAAKLTLSVREQNDIEEVMNNQVKQGLITREEANRLAKDEAQSAPILAAQTAAKQQGDINGYNAATKALANLTAEQKRANGEAIRAKEIDETIAINKRIDAIVKETAALEKYNAQRLAVMGADVGPTHRRGATTDSVDAAIRGDATSSALRKINARHEKELIDIKAQADADKVLADAVGHVTTETYKLIAAKLKQADIDKHTVDIKLHYDEEAAKIASFTGALQKLNDIAGTLNLSDAFGKAGGAIDGMVASLDKLTAAQEAHAAAVTAAGGDKAKIDKADVAYGEAKINNTIGLLHSAKGLFAEQSGAYKAIDALEKVAAARALVNTAIHVAAGAAKMFGIGGPAGFALVAAMMAVMASLGYKGGGSSAVAPPSAKDLQDSAGTGSVLGDGKAKSNSIADSLAIVASNTNNQLEYSNKMLTALQSIEAGISKLAGNVARQISVSGSLFDTSKANIGSSGSAGFLGLFASSTTRSLWDAGLKLVGSTVGDIVAQGVQGSTYQIVQQVKKSSGFLGIGGGTKTTYETTNGAIDPSITSAITDVVKSLRDGLVVAAGVFGIDGAAAIANNFKVQLGTISFKDLTGDQIEKQLNAIFSKVGDDMAGAILPSLSEIQKVGEGLFETFTRAAREYQVVDISLQSIGLAFGMVGVASIGARDNLVQLFGGLDQFATATAFYRDNFLTEAEKIAPVASAVASEMDRLGLAGVNTIDQFKKVVDGLDLTTQAGRDLYAALMHVAPAFSAVEKYQQKLAADAATATAAAAALANSRTSMEIRLQEALGHSSVALAMKRKQELAALDESLRGLQKQIYWAEDVAKARDVLNASYQRERGELVSTAEKFRGFANDLRTFKASLFAGDGSAGSYSRSLADLRSTGAMAAMGNESSISALPGASMAFLDASRASSATLLDYQRDVAKVSGIVDKAINGSEGMATAADRQLAALDQSVADLITLNTNVVSVEQAIAELRDLLGPPSLALADDQAKANAAAKNFQDDLINEVQKLRSEGESRELQMLGFLASLDTRFRRYEGDGMPVKNILNGILTVHTV
jgi:hypothetical protein